MKSVNIGLILVGLLGALIIGGLTIYFYFKIIQSIIAVITTEKQIPTQGISSQFQDLLKKVESVKDLKGFEEIQSTIEH
jgi:hypothetical protein